MRLTTFEEQALGHLEVLYRYSMFMVGDAFEATELIRRSVQAAGRLTDGNVAGERELKLTLLSTLRAMCARSDGVRTDRVRWTGSGGNGFGVIVDREIDQQIRSVIDNLDPQDRSALVLRYVEGLSVKEIARVEGTNVASIHGGLFESRRMIEDVLRQKATISDSRTRAAQCTVAAMHA